MSRRFQGAPWANAHGARYGGGERHISLKPPKWLRKMQPGKIIKAAAEQLPVIGGVVSAIGNSARTAVATVEEVRTTEGRQEAQGLIERGKGLLGDLDTTKKAMLAVAALGAIILVVVLVRRK